MLIVKNKNDECTAQKTAQNKNEEGLVKEVIFFQKVRLFEVRGVALVRCIFGAPCVFAAKRLANG